MKRINCSVVYHYCSCSDIIKLEKVQKKGLRFVHQDFHFSYTTLRKKSNRPLLYVERQRCILQKVYRPKRIHDLGPRYWHDLFPIKDREYDYRNVLKLNYLSIKQLHMAKTHYNLMMQSYLFLWEMILKTDLITQNLKQSSKLGMMKNVYVIIVHIVD